MSNGLGSKGGGKYNDKMNDYILLLIRMSSDIQTDLECDKPKTLHLDHFLGMYF